MNDQSVPKLNLRANNGFTLVELLVVLVVSILVITASINVTITLNRAFRIDRTRTRMNQDLRAASDLISADVRTAGSYLSDRILSDGGLQSVIVRNGNELEIRRSLVSTTLPVCQRINDGSNAGTVFISDDDDPPVRPECAEGSRDRDGDGQEDDFAEWVDYRNDTDENPDQTVAVYIWPSTNGNGEFFIYDAEDNTDQHIGRAGGNWQRTYDPSSTPAPDLYILEMRRYQLTDGVLEIVLNGDEDNPSRIVNNIVDFQVRAILNDGTVVDSFGEGPDDSFADIASIEIDIQAAEQVTPQVLVERQLNNRFFPRNILNF